MGNPFESLFGGGGGGGGLAAQNDFLAFQRAQIKRLRLEGDEADEFSKTLADFRRGVLADRPGFSGLVNVGSAVQASDARLQTRINTLATNDPERVRFEEAQAKEATTRDLNLRTISGEEFKVRERVRILADFSDVTSGNAQGRLDKLLAIRKERSGRYAGREDVTKAIAKARKLLKIIEKTSGPTPSTGPSLRPPARSTVRETVLRLFR